MFLIQVIKWSSFTVCAHFKLLAWDFFVLAVKSIHISRIHFSSFFKKQSKGQCIAGNCTSSAVSEGLVVFSVVPFLFDFILQVTHFQ